MALPSLVSLTDAARRLQLTPRRAARAVAAGLLQPVGLFLGGPLFDLGSVERLQSDLTIACLRQRDPRGRKSRAPLPLMGGASASECKVGEVREQPTGDRGAEGEDNPRRE